MEDVGQKAGDSGRKAEGRGQKQTAYQVLVATSEELLRKDKGDLWDSGKVASDQSIQVEYGGPSVSSRAGKPAGKAEGVKFLRMENGAAVYEVGSGRYRFCSEK